MEALAGASRRIQNNPCASPRGAQWWPRGDRRHELFGGWGGVFGTLVAALIISVVANGLVLLNVNPFWTQAVKGAIILMAVLADSIKRKSWYE